MQKVGIIDYNSGNIKSIQNMLKYLNIEHFIASSPKELEKADKLIFPGQGHFSQATVALQQSGLISQIKLEIEKKKPFLGFF